MRLFTYLAKLLLTVLLLWAFVYGLVRELTPDPGSALSGLNTDAATRRYLEAELGLNQPFPIALGRSLYRAVQFDFGASLRTRRPVLKEIAAPLMLTGRLALVVAILSTAVAALSFVLGLLRGIGVSSAFASGAAALAALPGFLLALLLAPWFPAYGLEDPAPRWMHLILPSVALLVPLLPYALSTGLRLAQDLRALPWFETFIAFGFGPLAIVTTRGRRWLLRGACNIAISSFLVAFTGSVAVELVCGLPGLGTAILDAIDARDLPVVLAISALTGAFASALVLTRSELERYADG